ncbi:MAG: hypothetical protein C0173_10120 [Desulfurella sp.]|uniref:hypothetical protein n=1 Tax=Desulfurella sp. TaxID=1962857 RepID=UPI000CBEE01F|nr:hypothetical protein [Desulfurella sp.]PMP87094.1 MAG: hypothetical protein C0173_10120 [Desulfurella sp.]
MNTYQYLEERLEKLEKKVRKTRKLIYQRNLETLIRKLTKENWILFKQCSVFSGEEEDIIKDNKEKFYLFAPKVAKIVKEKFKNAKFKHGYWDGKKWQSEDNYRFEYFLYSLDSSWISDVRIYNEDDFNVEYIECDRKAFYLIKKLYILTGRKNLIIEV